MVVETGETSASEGERSTVEATGLAKEPLVHWSCWDMVVGMAELGIDRGTAGTDDDRVEMRRRRDGEVGPVSISAFMAIVGMARQSLDSKSIKELR